MSIASVLLACLAVRAGAQTPAPTAAEALSPIDPIVASIRGTHDIHQSDVDAWRERHAPAQLTRLRQDVYDSSRQAVDALVGEYLLAEAAAEQGVSADALVRDGVGATSMAPSREEDVRDIYERSRSMMGNVTFEQARSAIDSYLQESRQRDARQAFIDRLLVKAAADIVIHLQPPRYEVPASSDDESFGPESAPLTVVEYSDFQCPFCKRAASDLRKLVERYPETVRLVWRHFPLPGHPEARGAAEAAACAGEQGAFWEYHDDLFAHQDSLGASDLRRYAEDRGLEMSQFDDCIDSHRYQSTVSDDLAGGMALGISATPAIFVNGRLIVGAVGYEAYQRVVDEELVAIERQGRR